MPFRSTTQDKDGPLEGHESIINESFCCSIFLLAFGIVIVLDFNHSNRYVVYLTVLIRNFLMTYDVKQFLYTYLSLIHTLLWSVQSYISGFRKRVREAELAWLLFLVMRCPPSYRVWYSKEALTRGQNQDGVSTLLRLFKNHD
jgi:hypothetical protein